MFTAREVAAVLGVTPARLRSYLRTGFVSPARGDDGEMRFTFQDLVLLRKAEGLVSERIPARRLTSALRKLRERLPRETPMTGVHLAAEGRQIVADDGLGRFHPESGQVVFTFEAPPTESEGASVTPLVHARPPAKVADEETALSAVELYERGCSLEDSKPNEARDLYRRALEKDPKLADAHVNLGRLLHEAGELHAALVHYRAAMAERPEDATAAFNAGVALEDLGMLEDAVETYRRSVSCDPANADAHYNVARLLEQMGKPEQAIRHLLIYRQLTKKR